MNCVLILEDEPFIALDLRYACEDAGLRAVMARTSRQAFDALTANPDIDGAVLDVNLGRGETCETAAQTLRELGIPFVLHTGDLNRAGETLRAIDAPILAKPVAAAEVIARLLELQRRAD